MLAHNVYFALTDNSSEAAEGLVGACKEYLCDHPGRDFDVALHVVFDHRASHDAYQAAPEHLSFIEEQKENWKNVRVFDSDVTGAG